MKTMVCFLILWILSTTSPALSQPIRAVPKALDSAPSPLLVLRVATDASGQAQETRFITEITLALDGVTVLGVDPGMPEFAQKPLAAQIITVRKLIDKHHGLAATWLNSVSQELVLLNMVVLSSGRALVRLIDGNPRRQGFVTDLAMAARELLGTAFLFNAAPTHVQSLSRVVEVVRNHASPKSNDTRSTRWTLVGRAGLSGGLAGFEGPSFQYSGGLAFERSLWHGLRARFFLQAQGGLFGEKPPLMVQSMMVGPGLGVSYLWRFGSVSVGPTFDLCATWTHLWVQVQPESMQLFTFLGLKVDIGPEMRVHLTQALSMVFGFSLGSFPKRKLLTLQSSGETLYASPFLAWQIAVGLAFDL